MLAGSGTPTIPLKLALNAFENRTKSLKSTVPESSKSNIPFPSVANIPYALEKNHEIGEVDETVSVEVADDSGKLRGIVESLDADGRPHNATGKIVRRHVNTAVES